jgi:hypothetical protein
MEAGFRRDWEVKLYKAMTRIPGRTCRPESDKHPFFPVWLIVDLKSIDNVDPSQIYAKS